MSGQGPQEGADQAFEGEFQQYNSHPKSRTNPGSTHHYNHMDSMNSFNPGSMDFSMMQDLGDDMDDDFFQSPDGDFDMNMDMFQTSYMPDVNASNMWQNSEYQTGASDPGAEKGAPLGALSAQGSIVNNRSHVEERYGQITPPDDDTSDVFDAKPPEDAADSKRKLEDEDIAKQNRTQRARKAANTRHSKSKITRRDSSQDVESEAGEGQQGQGKSTNVQREKNRLAAAKCRAKKKANSEEMQESHREGSRENSYLMREVRELRDQKAFLRNSLLQHDPSVCQCHAIHRFNLAQAHQLAMGVGAMMPQPLSPTSESVASAMTPASDGSLGSQIERAPRQPGAPRRASVSSRPQSFSFGSNFNIGQMGGPETYPTTSSADQSMSATFADFLHNSPNGNRPGFH